MLDHVDMENYDYVILRSATPRAAGAYIENVWASLTAKQKNSVAAAYFGISKNEFMRGKSKPKAGGRSRPIFPKPIVEMLAVVDSFHDFNKHLNLQDLVRDKLPVGFSANDLLNEKSFLKKLALQKELKFAGPQALFPNPAYGCDLDQKYFIAPQDGNVNIENVIVAQHQSVAARREKRLVPFDVVTRYYPFDDDELARKRLEYLKLRQIASLLCLMRRKFSSRLDILVDGNKHPLCGIAVGIKNLWNEFAKKFKTDPPTRSFVELAARLKEIIQEGESGSGSEASAECKMTDANVFDSQINTMGLPVDPRPTGKVFSSNFKLYDDLQVVLDGVAKVQERKAAFSLLLENTSFQNLEISSSQAQEHFSNNHIAKLINTRSSNKNTPLQKTLSKLSRNTLLGIKLAGDWGQVENCRRYKKVFLTQDKIAALYAYCVGVEFILFSVEERSAPGDKEKPENDFFRYTFLLGGHRPRRSSAPFPI